MNENSKKVISFPSRVPAKADYQRVKASYSVREIKQLFGLSERTIRRWTEQGVIQATPTANNDFSYDFQALTQFRRVRELRAQGQSIRQIEAELQGQLHLFRGAECTRVSRLLTPFEEALLLHEQGDVKAAESYQEAISDGDNVAEAYCNLGIINLDLGQRSKALDDFSLARLHYEAAAQIESGFSLVYFNLALVYHRIGDLASALSALERYKQLSPDDEEIEAVDQLLKVMQESRGPRR